MENHLYLYIYKVYCLLLLYIICIGIYYVYMGNALGRGVQIHFFTTSIL